MPQMVLNVLMSSRVHYKTNIIPIPLNYIVFNDKKVKEKFLILICYTFFFVYIKRSITVRPRVRL